VIVVVVVVVRGIIVHQAVVGRVSDYSRHAAAGQWRLPLRCYEWRRFNQRSRPSRRRMLVHLCFTLT